MSFLSQIEVDLMDGMIDALRPTHALALSVSERAQRAHSILGLLRAGERERAALAGGNVRLFAALCRTVISMHLEHLADTVHDLWCAKYMDVTGASFNAAIQRLEVDQASHSRFLKKYSEFDEGEQAFEKELITNDFRLLVKAFTGLDYDDAAADALTLDRVGDLEIMQSVGGVLLSSGVLRSLCAEANALWAQSVRRHFPADDRMAPGEVELTLSGFDQDKCLQGLYIDLAGLYVTLMELRYGQGACR